MPVTLESGINSLSFRAFSTVKVSINEQDFQQLVLPPIFHQEVFQALHDDLGHQGRDRTTSLFKQRFFWPGMDAFVKESVRACDRCIRRKAVGGKVLNL